MSWTRVQSAGAGNTASGATLSVSLTNPVTTGNLVVLAISWGDTSTPSITDDVGGNTYPILDNTDETVNSQSAAASGLVNITNGPKTFTLNSAPATAFRSIQVEEWSCTGGPSPGLDGHQGKATINVANGGGFNAGTGITTTTNGDLVWSSYSNSTAGNSATHGTGFADSLNPNPNANGSGSEQQTQTSSGSIQGTWVNNTGGTANWVANVVAFKPFVATGTIDVPSSYPSRPFPRQWNLSAALFRGAAQDTSSFGVETNPHWQGRTWAMQWSPLRALTRNSDSNAPFAQPETNTFFTPRTRPVQWNPLPLARTTAQDFSSFGVETNPHWRGRVWPVVWTPAVPNRVPAVDVPAPPAVETNTYFIPRTWSVQWTLTVGLLRGAPQDFSTVVVVTQVQYIMSMSQFFNPGSIPIG